MRALCQTLLYVFLYSHRSFFFGSFLLLFRLNLRCCRRLALTGQDRPISYCYFFLLLFLLRRSSAGTGG